MSERNEALEQLLCLSNLEPLKIDVKKLGEAIDKARAKDVEKSAIDSAVAKHHEASTAQQVRHRV